MFRAILYWCALFFSGFITLSTFVILATTVGMDPAHSTTPEVQIQLADIMLIFPLFLTSLATLSTILLGWRVDRRQVKELDLKTKELELKNKELELKLASAQVPNIQPPTQQFPNF
jgi:hypothetical protein